jgi:PBP1b-binding outer membrane lipoprotein LpoB
MKAILMVLLSMVFLSGCTKEKACSVGETAAAVLAVQIAAQLDCKNVGAIQADVVGVLVSMKVCDIKPAGTIGNVICTPLVNALASGLLSKIPSSWSCSGGKLTEAGKVKLVEVCLGAI